MNKATTGKFLGALTQGIILGLLVSWGIFELWAKAGDVNIFRYQGF